MNVPTSASRLTDPDEFIQSLYTLAVEADWQRFREQGMEQLCAYLGAKGMAWLTHSGREADGEFSEFPRADGAVRGVLAGVELTDSRSEVIFATLPREWMGATRSPCSGIVVRYAHRGGGLQSLVLLRFPLGQTAAEGADIRRAVSHLVEAGALALRHFIQRDEWLYALGRPNRGTAALVDQRGTVYAASARFRDYVSEVTGSSPSFAHLPFKLPDAVVDGEDHFVHSGTLHFRVSRQGHLFLLHARRPLPMDALSPREQEIARALGNGKTFKSVARQYDIAVSTVANHASRIYRKLGIYRREDLVELVRQPGTRNQAA
jgi:DNA-binding CsgD family transcriptional regulator